MRFLLPWNGKEVIRGLVNVDRYKDVKFSVAMMFVPINCHHTSFLIILYLHAPVSPSLAQQLMRFHSWLLL